MKQAFFTCEKMYDKLQFKSITITIHLIFTQI